MVGDIYSNQAVAKSLPRWPHFPQLRSFLSEAGANPGRIRARVARFVPLTLVGEARECEFPAVPPLEPSLTAIFLPKAMFFFGGRRPTPPSPCDQVTTRLTDRAHQCAAQAAAAVNNVLLLASSLSSIAAQPVALPSELADEIGKIAATTLTLSSALAVTQSRIMAWMTMIQRNLWLNMSQLPEQTRKGLLEGPISPKGLFGPFLNRALTHLQEASEEADRVKEHTSWVQAAPQAFGFQASWRGRREQRSPWPRL
ncbi:hypothetical protein F2P81_020360 [Scophthalmus maximus]|uniref:Uncharacterized protein n=1 Tax=Scophthalmus maximus TaxID=52904 RepID=A0A6A4S510_SCOMX|nr:hypothetical protein F2P81_020360 [Scophthalmus maximus]